MIFDSLGIYCMNCLLVLRCSCLVHFVVEIFHCICHLCCWILHFGWFSFMLLLCFHLLCNVFLKFFELWYLLLIVFEKLSYKFLKSFFSGSSSMASSSSSNIGTFLWSFGWRKYLCCLWIFYSWLSQFRSVSFLLLQVRPLLCVVHRSVDSSFIFSFGAQSLFHSQSGWWPAAHAAPSSAPQPWAPRAVSSAMASRGNAALAASLHLLCSWFLGCTAGCSISLLLMILVVPGAREMTVVSLSWVVPVQWLVSCSLSDLN